MSDFIKGNLTESELERLLFEHILENPDEVNDEVWEVASETVFANEYTSAPALEKEAMLTSSQSIASTWRWILSSILLLAYLFSFYVDFQYTQQGDFDNDSFSIVDNSQLQELNADNNGNLQSTQKKKSNANGEGKRNDTESIIAENATNETLLTEVQGEEQLASINKHEAQPINEKSTLQENGGNLESTVLNVAESRELGKQTSSRENDINSKDASSTDFYDEKLNYGSDGQLIGLEKDKKRQDLSNYEGEYYSKEFGYLKMKFKRNKLQVSLGKKKLEIESLDPNGRAAAAEYKNDGLSTFFQFNYDNNQDVQSVEITEMTSTNKKVFKKVQ